MTTLSIIFEVLDKEDSLQSIWVSAFVVALVGYLLARWRWWLIWPFLPLAVLFALFQLSEFFEPYIGNSMWAESHGYVIQLFASGAIAVLFPCLGAYQQRKKTFTSIVD